MIMDEIGIHFGYTKCIITYFTPEKILVIENRENEIYTHACEARTPIIKIKYYLLWENQ